MGWRWVWGGWGRVTVAMAGLGLVGKCGAVLGGVLWVGWCGLCNAGIG